MWPGFLGTPFFIIFVLNMGVMKKRYQSENTVVFRVGIQGNGAQGRTNLPGAD